MKTYVPVCPHAELHGSAFITCAFAFISVLKVNSLVNICQQFLNLKYSRLVQIKNPLKVSMVSTCNQK